MRQRPSGQRDTQPGRGRGEQGDHDPAAQPEQQDRRAVMRVVIGGAIGLAFTYGVGHLFGTAIG